MYNGARATAVHQRDVDDGGVVVARVLPGTEDGGQGDEAPVRLVAGPGVASVHHPVEQGGQVGVNL